MFQNELTLWEHQTPVMQERSDIGNGGVQQGTQGSSSYLSVWGKCSVLAEQEVNVLVVFIVIVFGKYIIKKYS